MKRITIITGHYGSGKSEFSVNLALAKQVDYLVDLDIVNPYFRSREVESILGEHHIKMVSSTLSKALGSDLPYISRESFTPFYDKSKTAIYDLGGDDVGARLLRQYKNIIQSDDVLLLFCINVFREQTSTLASILNMMQKIESSGGVKIGGLINNSNFLRETTLQDIKQGEALIQEVQEYTKLPILYTGVLENLVSKDVSFSGEILPLKLYLRKKWL